jgi:ATP-dependent DNA ligase
VKGEIVPQGAQGTFSGSYGPSLRVVAAVKYLTWTNDNLLRQVVYEGLREDKPADEVRGEVPRPNPASANTPPVPPRRPRP